MTLDPQMLKRIASKSLCIPGEPADDLDASNVEAVLLAYHAELRADPRRLKLVAREPSSHASDAGIRAFRQRQRGDEKYDAQHWRAMCDALRAAHDAAPDLLGSLEGETT
jgi:hypothetical protein